MYPKNGFLSTRFCAILPTSMNGIVGHEALKTVFERLIERDALSHAYVFTGSESVGKSTFMRALSARTLQTTAESLSSHPDFSRVVCPVDEKTGVRKIVLPVEAIRDLRESLSMSAFLGGWRVAMIEDAAAMSAGAANALLKILEEPPKKTLILLRATRPEDLPHTIVSRTQVVRLRTVASGTIVSALVERGASKKEAEELARVALGRPGVAIRFLTDREAYAAWRAQMETLAHHVMLGAVERLALAKRLAPKEEPKNHDHGETIFQAWESAFRERLRTHADAGRFVRALERLNESREAFRHHTQLQLAFEHTLLSL